MCGIIIRFLSRYFLATKTSATALQPDLPYSRKLRTVTGSGIGLTGALAGLETVRTAGRAKSSGPDFCSWSSIAARTTVPESDRPSGIPVGGVKYAHSSEKVCEFCSFSRKSFAHCPIPLFLRRPSLHFMCSMQNYPICSLHLSTVNATGNHHIFKNFQISVASRALLITEDTQIQIDLLAFC